MANMTATGEEFGIPQVSPFEVGMFNFMSWGLLIMVLLTIFLRFGKNKILKESDE